MPAHYAHYYFGKEIIRNMPEDIKAIINNDRETLDAYLIGLQGPDFLAFYRPYTHNELNREGQRIHNAPGSVFFEKAVRVTREQNKPAYYSYLIGSLCHYMFDSTCHPLVSKYMKELDVTHAKVEREFDNYLLAKDGKKPYNLDTRNIFPYNRALGPVISGFYETPSPGQVNQAIGEMDHYLAMMCNKNAGIRAAIHGILSIIRIEGVSNKKDMVVRNGNDHVCDGSSRALYKAITDCVRETCEEIDRLMDAVLLDAPLSERLRLNYLGKKVDFKI